MGVYAEIENNLCFKKKQKSKKKKKMMMKKTTNKATQEWLYSNKEPIYAVLHNILLFLVR